MFLFLARSNILLLCLLLSSLIASHHQKPVLDQDGQVEFEQQNQTTGKACLVVRLAVFVSYSLKSHLNNNLKLRNNTQMERFLASYVEQVEVIFGNLKSKSISRIHIELAQVDYESFPGQFSDNFSEPNIDQLLDKFCRFQDKKGRNWNLSLLLTAQDLYSDEEARLLDSKQLSLATMGVSVTNSIDWHDLSCLIVELGIDYDNPNLEDKKESRVYPSRGLSSAWIAAHEIAHSLGLSHDTETTQLYDGDCAINPTSNYIMSSSSYLNSLATQWSDCSLSSFDKKDWSDLTEIHYHDETNLSLRKSLPGQLFDANFQCLAFSGLLKEANIYKGNICNETLWCETYDGKLVAIGPAWEGTQCGPTTGSLCIKNSSTTVV